ncbi:MAG: hypothetical protein AAF460_17335 [Pseudomonadota bacterium]
MRSLIALVVVCLGLGVAHADEENAFRRLFDAWYAANPPRTVPASATEQALLRDHQPVVYLAPDQPRFIDFYADYIGSGRLSVDGTHHNTVDQTLLNAHGLDATARFVHTPRAPTAPAVAYARYDQDGFVANGRRFDFEFLTYNYVFAHSGLPCGLRWWQRFFAGIVNGNHDWHQLDHYVGATLALYNGSPVAVTLQQHNYLTTWRIPDGLALGPDGRVHLDVAIGSNELYPHSPTRTRHPTVSFITPDNIEFLMTGTNRPALGAYDVTDGQLAVDYRLQFLAPADAFYGFRGNLGAKRRLPGRSGPPGADYNTLPGLKPYATAMAVSWRGDSLDAARARLRALLDGWAVQPAGVQAAIDTFAAAAGLRAD